MGWMAWTTTTAFFFIFIAMVIFCMSIYEIKNPCIERKGFFPIVTTRGDRLFIGLLSSAFIHLLFLGVTDLNLWIASVISFLWVVIVLRWG